MTITNQTLQLDTKRILARLANDHDLLQELIDIFREDAPLFLTRMKRAINDGDHHELELSAHALKGLVSNFMHDPTTALALSLEKKSRTPEWSEMVNLFEELHRSVNCLMTALDTLATQPLEMD